MKASLFMVGASAILASASPIGNALKERAMKTEWVYEVVTIVVTEDAQAKPTAPVYKAPEAPKVTQEAEKPKVVKVAPKPKATQEAPKPAPVKAEEAPKPVVVTVYADPKPTQEVKKVEEKKVVVVKPAAPSPVYEAPEPVEKPKTTVKKVVKPAPTKAEPKLEPKVTVEASIESSDLDLEGAYDKVMLAYHNIHRANHSAPALEWDDELAGYAENTANGCVFEHDMKQGKGGYGQNLASWGATSDIDGLKNKAAAGGITNQWYDSEMSNWAFYGQENPPSDMNIDLYGHFTQVVWKDSTKVGCATVKCPAGSVLSFPSWYTVCNYNPQGNFGGRYADNVLKPEGAKRVTV
jgi:uncharacterized protein YkwD